MPTGNIPQTFLIDDAYVAITQEHPRLSDSSPLPTFQVL